MTLPRLLFWLVLGFAIFFLGLGILTHAAFAEEPSGIRGHGHAGAEESGIRVANTPSLFGAMPSVPTILLSAAVSLVPIRSSVAFCLKMPTNDAEQLRDMARRIRGMALVLPLESDRASLRQYADELEQRAAELEGQSPKQTETGP